MEKELVYLLTRIARSELRLEEFMQLNAPRIILDREVNLIKQHNEALNKYILSDSSNGSDINKTKEEVFYAFFRNEADEIRRKIRAPFCPACRFSYEYPDGRRKHEEGFEDLHYLEDIEPNDAACTLFPKSRHRFHKSCKYFEDYGIIKWENHYGGLGSKLDILKKRTREIEERRPELAGKYRKKVSLIDKIIRYLI